MMLAGCQVLALLECILLVATDPFALLEIHKVVEFELFLLTILLDPRIQRFIMLHINEWKIAGVTVQNKLSFIKASLCIHLVIIEHTGSKAHKLLLQRGIVEPPVPL
jgi:hypothetical protein